MSRPKDTAEVHPVKWKHDRRGDIHAAVDAIDGKHVPRILLTLDEQPLRFCQLARHVDAHDKVLAQTLDRLLEDGLIARSAEDADRKVVYELTRSGRAVIPILHWLGDWHATIR